MKKAIENILNDNKKIDEEIDLLNTVIINKYSNIMYNNEQMYRDNDNYFGINKKNPINEIMENDMNKNDDVFGEDEII